MARALHMLYGDFPLESGEFADFHVRVDHPVGRRWIRPQVQFSSDDGTPFAPLPARHAYAVLEWCMNWCIAQNAHQYLLLHSASLDNEGRAVILAAPPGSGKSTLAAVLTAGGRWRLLSDEFTLLDDDGCAKALCRPIALKNQSIDLMQELCANPVIGPVAHETAKGTIAHLRPPHASVLRMDQSSAPRWVIFPKYVPDAPLSMQPLAKAEALLDLAENAFNYDYLGVRGFERVADLIEQCDAFRLHYSVMADAIGAFSELARGR